MNRASYRQLLLAVFGTDATASFVADQLGYSRQGVRATRIGEYDPPEHVLRRLADIAGIDRSYYDGIPLLRARAMTLVRNERERQVSLFGNDAMPELDIVVTNAILDIEGEARDANDTDRHTWISLVVEELAEALREPDAGRRVVELAQVAALVHAWIEALLFSIEWSPRKAEPGNSATGE